MGTNNSDILLIFLFMFLPAVLLNILVIVALNFLEMNAGIVVLLLLDIGFIAYVIGKTEFGMVIKYHIKRLSRTK